MPSNKKPVQYFTISRVEKVLEDFFRSKDRVDGIPYRKRRGYHITNYIPRSICIFPGGEVVLSDLEAALSHSGIDYSIIDGRLVKIGA